MSDSDLSGRLPGPVTARPRRPLSNSASTASWSMRFSLLTMISGAPRSSRRLRRLLRLITRRYRSFRSEVAKRPPSSWTIGRSSGGITGTTSRIIQSGRCSLLWNAETTFRRLIARCCFWPLPVAICSLSSSTSCGMSSRARRSRTASAPMPSPMYSPKPHEEAKRSLSSRATFSSPMTSLGLMVWKTCHASSSIWRRSSNSSWPSFLRVSASLSISTILAVHSSMRR